MIELAQEFDVHPNKISQWRDQLLEGATWVFGEAPKADPEPTIDLKTLYVKIGKLTLGVQSRHLVDRVEDETIRL